MILKMGILLCAAISMAELHLADTYNDTGREGDEIKLHKPYTIAPRKNRNAKLKRLC